jgi:serine/threonine protein phosphatase PrpC
MLPAHAGYHRVSDGSVCLCWSGSTDRGRHRPNNEDAYLGLQFDARELHRLGKFGSASLSRTDFVFAVSDGMGGALAGEYASQIAIEKIATLLPRSFAQVAGGLQAGVEDVFADLFDQIHRALVYVGASYEECYGMEATLSLAWFTPGWMYFGHVGDSRIYFLPGKAGGIRQVTHDDTHVGWLLRNGRINEREARNHPRRSALQKALGGNNQFVDPQVGAVAFESGDAFLLCTDGLTEGLYNDHLVELVRCGTDAQSHNSIAQRLVSEALRCGSRDNITALVVQIR